MEVGLMESEAVKCNFPPSPLFDAKITVLSRVLLYPWSMWSNFRWHTRISE